MHGVLKHLQNEALLDRYQELAWQREKDEKRGVIRKGEVTDEEAWLLRLMRFRSGG